MSLKKIFIKDGSWNTLDFITSVIFSFISVKILVDALGLSNYGIYAFFNGITSTFALADLGLGIAVSKYLAEYIPLGENGKANEVLTVGLVFYFAVGLILFLLCWMFGSQIMSFFNLKYATTDLSGKIILIIPVILGLRFISTLFNNVLVACQQWKTIAFVNIGTKIINFGAIVFVATHTISFPKIFALFLIQLIIGALTIAVLAIISGFYHKFKITFHISTESILRVGNFLKYSFLQYIFSYFLGHIDKFIIAKFIGYEVLAVYDICAKLYGYMHGFLSNLFKVTFPKLSQLHSLKDFRQIRHIIVKSQIVSTSLAVCALFGIVLFWKPLMSIYINRDFAKASYIIMLLYGILFVVRSFEIIYYYLFNSIAKPKFLAFSTLFIGLINVVLYMILLPKIGVKGLVLAQIISNAVMLAFLSVVVYRGPLLNKL